jgi:hypothetical protein
MPVGVATPFQGREKDTQMDWGKSQSGARRSRRRAALAIAALLAISVVVFLAIPRALEKPTAEEPSQPVVNGAAAPAEPSVPMVTPAPVPAPIVTELAVASASASAVVTAREPAKPPARAPKPAAARPVTATRMKAPTPPTVPEPPTPEEDPLDSRR